MAKLTQGQIAMYAAAAGAPDPQLAAAVAMAESSGVTTRHNPVPPDDSYGLWQINMIGSEGPERRRALGITSNSQLYDPATNARAMMLVSNGGTNWHPWTTYTNGEYRQYLGKSTAAAAAGAQQAGVWGDIGNGVVSGIDPLGGLFGIDPLQNLLDGGSSAASALDWVGKAVSWVSKASNWVRVGYVIGGAALVVVGVAMVAKDQELKVATKTVGQALGSGGSKVKAAAGRRKNEDQDEGGDDE